MTSNKHKKGQRSQQRGSSSKRFGHDNNSKQQGKRQQKSNKNRSARSSSNKGSFSGSFNQ